MEQKSCFFRKSFSVIFLQYISDSSTHYGIAILLSLITKHVNEKSFYRTEIIELSTWMAFQNWHKTFTKWYI